jgi:uncharacterized membrane protein HdeD (DUF308 family)
MAAGTQAREWGSWWVPMGAGLISVIAGVLAIVWPDVTLLALALIAGINLVVLSGFLIVDGIGADDRGDRTLRIVVGVLGVIAGLIVMRRPGETLLVLILAVGIWLVLDGIMEMIRGILVASEHRALRIAGGLFDLVLGICILALPELSLGTVAVLIGIGFVIRGVLLAVGGWQLRGIAAEGAPGPTPVTPTPA